MQAQRKTPVSRALRHSGRVKPTHKELTTEWQGLLEILNAEDKGQRWKGESPRQAGKRLHREGDQKKTETLPPPSPWKQFKVHSRPTRKSKKIKASSLPWSPLAISLRLLANTSLLRTGCHTAQWHKLGWRHDGPSAIRAGNKQILLRPWGLAPSTPQTGGGNQRQSAIFFPRSRASVLEQRVKRYSDNDSGRF